MIEKTILDYLNDNLGVPVYMERPIKPPKTYVLIDRTSGTLTEHVIASSTFAIQSYADSLYKAANLNEDVIKAVRDLVELDEITFVAIDGYYNFTDASTNDYRYQAVVRVGHYFF